MKISKLTSYKIPLNRKNHKQNLKKSNVSNSVDIQLPNYKIYCPALSFGTILYKNISPKYEKQREIIRNEIDTFSNSGNNVQYLGKGLFSEAFAFYNMPDIVIKQAFNKYETFFEEESGLESIPANIPNTQKFVARVYDDEERRYYLLSTKVAGSTPEPNNNPWTRQHLKNFFETLYKMDEAGFYHGDLNCGNIKITPDGNINLLDFQYTNQVSKIRFFEEKKDSILPDFIFLENSQMFEMANLPFYLKSMKNKDRAKQFLKTYLVEKSTYHKKRYDLVSQLKTNWQYYNELPIIDEAKKFEKAQAEVLKNPSNDILRIEAKKLQFLSAFREAYQCTDPNFSNRNPLAGTSAYLFTMSCVQDFRKDIEEHRKNVLLKINNIEQKENGFWYIFASSSTVENNKREKENLNYQLEYLSGQEKYGDFWLKKLQTWTENIGTYSRGCAMGIETFDYSKSTIKADKFPPISNILATIDDNYQTKYTNDFSFKTEENENLIKFCRLIINKLSMESSQQNITNIKQKIEELEHLQENLNTAYKSSFGLDVINYSLLGIMKSKELSEIATKSILNEMKYLKTLLAGSENMKNYYLKLFSNCFNKILQDIKSNNPSSNSLNGYSNMGKFN